MKPFAITAFVLLVASVIGFVLGTLAAPFTAEDLNDVFGEDE